MGSKTTNINKVIYIIFGILFIATILSILTLTNIHVSADDSPNTAAATTTNSATASVNVSAACSMSATNTTHTATLTPGTFTEDIGLTNVTATCNDPLGYAIYAVGYSNNTYGNTSLIGPDDNTIATGTSTSGDTSNWSMKLGTGTGDSAAIVTTPTNYTTYAPVPSTYTKVAAYTNGTTTGQAGTSFTTTYGVYTSPSQPAGTYTGAVRYTLVHPHNAIPQDKYYMQDFTLAQCEVLAHDRPITVYDKRDNEPYLVQYLKDGNCWMLDNLRLGSNEEPIKLSPLDTNIKEPWTLPQGITEGFTGYTEAHINAAYKNDPPTVDGVTYAYGQGSGKIGVYYNYCAASGGTYCYDASGGINDAEYDICPTGWRMPTGGANGEYQNLYEQYDSSKLASDVNSLQYNLSTPLSGRFNNSAQYYVGNNYGSWASTYYGNGTRMYRISTFSDRVDAKDYGSRGDGRSVRCLANNE